MKAGTVRPPLADRLAEQLGTSKRTVTQFVEALVGERLFAEKLRQSRSIATDGLSLSVEPGCTVLNREALLRGQRSLRSYVHAKAVVVPDRLPPGMVRRLEETTEPIGHLIVEYDLDVARVDLPTGVHPLGDPPPTAAAGCIYARQYRIDRAGQPIIEVAEWFLPSLTEHLADLDRTMEPE